MTVNALTRAAPGSVPAALAAGDALIAAMAARLPPGVTARTLGMADADAVRALRGRVIQTLDHPDFYQPAAEYGNFVTDHLNVAGVTVGLFLGTELVAFGALGLPGAGPDTVNRGRDLPLPEAELLQVAHLSSAMVDPNLRGRGLHHWTIDWRLGVADRIGRRHALTTASPRNHRSWGHLAAHGLYPRRLIGVNSGILRLLMHRDSMAEPVFDPATASLVTVEDLADRADLFERGEQVWCRLHEGGRWFALFGRARPAAA
ncbi:GNAT family N-acetyltransferase [Azospirillum sp.]|uniref:GNAT family N-acetyltransferase n=1 Tax=Azospirillum sp. TaxID=34012 RepID=UPI003D70D506